jgi:hypothetical protein
MIDRTTQLQVSGRIADRQVEARARRLAAEAASHGSEERTFWLTDGIRAITGSGSSVMARLRRVSVKPATTLTPARHRP